MIGVQVHCVRQHAMHRIARWTLRVSRAQYIASRAGRRASAARNASLSALDAARQPRAMHPIPRSTPRAQPHATHPIPRSTPHVSRAQCIASHARRRTSAARNASHPTLDAARQPHATHPIPSSTPRVSRTQHVPAQARRRASAARNTSHPTRTPHVSRTQRIASHARPRASAARISRTQHIPSHARRRAERGWHEGRSPRAL